MRNPFQSNKRRFRALENRIVFTELALETYFNNPEYVHSDEVGFNGQIIRKQIFNNLFDIFSFDEIIETGTFTGNTTGYMSKTTGKPVYTCESNRVLSSLAKKRLSGIGNIEFYVMDSREFLNALSSKAVSDKNVFIYLDAHCHDDLPLKQEVEIICRTWKQFVIMIDDFQVPGDTGYGYDSYVGNQILSTDVFLPVFKQNGLIPFFPSISSSDESGAKRGCVILSREGDAAKKIEKCELLKGYQS